MGEHDSINRAKRRRISLAEFGPSKEGLVGVLGEVGAEVSVDNGVSSGGEDVYLGKHLIISVNAFMPEWSKGPHSRCGEFARVSSNLTERKFFF